MAAGGVVLVIDDERAGAGAVVAAGQSATAETIRFMSREAAGWRCLALTPERCEELRFGTALALDGRAPDGPMVVSLDAREGLTNGTSAADQARTIRVAADPVSRPSDLSVPGHVLAVRARSGGVLERTGRAEAGIDLARISGCDPSAVICTIEDEHDQGMTQGDLLGFARRHEIPVVLISELIRYRLRHDRLVERAVAARMPTRFGEFSAIGYNSIVDGLEHLALVRGDLSGPEPVLVRVHSECLLGSAFHGLLCDCGDLLERAMGAIEDEGRGVFVHLAAPDSSRLVVHSEAATAQGVSLADDRQAAIGAAILSDLGLHAIRVLADRLPDDALKVFGFAVEEGIPLGR